MGLSHYEGWEEGPMSQRTYPAGLEVRLLLLCHRFPTCALSTSFSSLWLCKMEGVALLCLTRDL